MGVDKLGKFVKNIGHFVSALAAADVYDNICLRPLGQLMLQSPSLPVPNGPGNCGHAAFGDWEYMVSITRCPVIIGSSGASFFYIRVARGVPASFAEASASSRFAVFGFFRRTTGSLQS